MSTMQTPQDGVAIDPAGIACPYERFVAGGIRRGLLRIIGLEQVRLLHTEWGETHNFLYDLLEDAGDKNAIGDDEYYDLLNAAVIAVGKNADGQDAYAVVEIGVTLNSTHVNRAARRARALAEATGAECSAVTVGSEIPDAERQRATWAGVAAIAVAAPED